MRSCDFRPLRDLTAPSLAGACGAATAGSSPRLRTVPDAALKLLVTTGLGQTQVQHDGDPEKEDRKSGGGVPKV